MWEEKKNYSFKQQLAAEYWGKFVPHEEMDSQSYNSKRETGLMFWVLQM